MSSSGFSPVASSPSIPPWGTQPGGGPVPPDPEPLCDGCLDEPLDVYVDPVNGNDANDGLTELTPWLTLEHADSQIAGTLLGGGNATVHLASGTHNVARPYVWSSRRFSGGRFRVYADEAWDPNVYTVVQAATAAGVGSTASSIVGVFVADAFNRCFLRVLTGAAAGRMVTVRNNTAGEIVPVAVLTGLVAGDEYEVLTWGVLIACTAPGPGNNLQPALPSAGEISGRGGSNSSTCYEWIGVRFELSANTYWEIHNKSNYVGVRFDYRVITYAGAEMMMGDPFSDVIGPLVLGWGITFGRDAGGGLNLAALQSADGGYFYGYFVANGDAGSSGGRFLQGAWDDGTTMRGGRIHSSSTIAGIVFDGAAVPILIPSTGGLDFDDFSGSLTNRRNNLLAGITFEAGSALTIGRGTRVRVDSDATGAPSITLEPNSHVVFAGQPVIDGWDIGDGMGALLGSYFDAVGACRIFNSKVLERVS
jgi:hypothetical protein